MANTLTAICNPRDPNVWIHQDIDGMLAIGHAKYITAIQYGDAYKMGENLHIDDALLIGNTAAFGNFKSATNWLIYLFKERLMAVPWQKLLWTWRT